MVPRFENGSSNILLAGQPTSKLAALIRVSDAYGRRIRTQLPFSTIGHVRSGRASQYRTLTCTAGCVRHTIVIGRPADRRSARSAPVSRLATNRPAKSSSSASWGSLNVVASGLPLLGRSRSDFEHGSIPIGR